MLALVMMDISYVSSFSPEMSSQRLSFVPSLPGSNKPEHRGWGVELDACTASITVSYRPIEDRSYWKGRLRIMVARSGLFPAERGES